MLAVQGLDIKRAVLAFWVGYAAAELKPVYLRLRELILTSGKVVVDETTAPVLDPGRGRTKQGYFWAVARDDRPWGGPIRRPSSSPMPLGGAPFTRSSCSTVIAASCNATAMRPTRASLPRCRATRSRSPFVAHLRRRVYDIAKGGDAPIASEALERIAALYAMRRRSEA